MSEWIKINDKDRGWQPVNSDAPSELESLVRGSGQSLLLGWGDEAEAAVRSALSKKTYEEALLNARNANKLAKETNPISYGVGEYAVPLAVPLGGTVKALSTAGKVALGAGIGGLAGLGTTEGEKLSKEGLVNSAVGAGVGGLATYGIQKIADKLAARSAANTNLANKAQSEITDVVNPSNLPTESETAKAIDEMRGIYDPGQIDPELQNVWNRTTGLPKESVPKYLGTTNKQLESLADDVLNSTTASGQRERGVLRPANEAIDRFASAVEKEGGSLSKHGAGSKIKDIFKSEFEKEMALPRSIYSEIESQFKDVPIRNLSIDRSLNRLDKEFGKLDPSGKSKALISRLRDFSQDIDSVDKLRKVRENLFKSFRPDELTDNESSIVNEFYNVLTRERNRSILNNVLKEGPKEAQNLSVESAQEVLGKLKTADSLWKQGLEKFSSVLPISERRGSSTANAIHKYLNNESTPLEQYAADMFDKGDLNGLLRLKDKFPQVFDVVRKRALSESVEKATSPRTGMATSGGIIGQLGRLKDQTTRDALFGEQLSKQLNDVQALQGAMPRNFNPSGTANRLMQEGTLLRPSKWIPEIGRQLQYGYKEKLLHGEVPKTAEILNAAKRFSPREIIIKLSRSPEGSSYAQILQRAAERGDGSYSATYFLLHKSEPRFREVVERENENDNKLYK